MSASSWLRDQAVLHRARVTRDAAATRAADRIARQGRHATEPVDLDGHSYSAAELPWTVEAGRSPRTPALSGNQPGLVVDGTAVLSAIPGGYTGRLHRASVQQRQEFLQVSARVKAGLVAQISRGHNAPGH